MASPRSRIFLFLAGFSCLLLLPRLQAQTAADADTGHDPGPQPQSVAGEEVKEGSHEEGEQALGSAEADTGHDPGPPPQRVAVEEVKEGSHEEGEQMDTMLKTDHGNYGKPRLVSEGTKIPIPSPHDPEEEHSEQPIPSPHDPEEHSEQPIPSPYDPEERSEQPIPSPHDPEEEHSEQPIPSPHDPEEHSEPIPSPHDPEERSEPISSPHDPEERSKPETSSETKDPRSPKMKKGTEGKRRQSKIGKRLTSLTRKYGSSNLGKMLRKHAIEMTRNLEGNKKPRKSRSLLPYTLIPSLDDGVNRNPGSHNKGTEGKRKQYMIGEKLVSKARKLESHKGGKMLGKYAAKLRKDFENNKKTRKSPSRKPSLDDNVNRNPGSHQNKGTEGKRKRSKISKTVTSEVRKYGSSKFGEMLGKYGPYKSLTDPKTKSGVKASGIEKPKKRMGKAKVSSSKARKSGSSKGGKTLGKNAAEPARNLERKKKN